MALALPKKYHPEVRQRAARMVLDRRAEHDSGSGAPKGVASKLNVGVEALRKRVVEALIEAGETTGPTTAELEQISKFDDSSPGPEAARELLNAATAFLTGELDSGRR